MRANTKSYKQKKADTSIVGISFNLNTFRRSVYLMIGHEH
ncbi:hypothetical protein VCRA2128O305_20232 [Vibrio crassostreae]|nr:hypothetical protein VCRA2119O145_110040 [Vibrio crassostreae]CAK1869632.1 hypothetical protein VCRA2113O231_10320 [Vibrio crassostreae]CAK1870795.1 hypothetical protein VCRA2112O191_10320 [Vibrio crassostreae]CAK1993474.1 hypothetical protein VCRA2119O245_20331 [Vibrio crassostreae]CAK2009350.1 hypothetical protein VCRA2112O184_20321 [Vibrio crassostreae]